MRSTARYALLATISSLIMVLAFLLPWLISAGLAYLGYAGCGGAGTGTTPAARRNDAGLDRTGPAAADA